jgi:hypothetical protein
VHASGTRTARVRTAERAGGARPTEDRIVTTPYAVAVLDGASQPDPTEHDGGWIADTLARELGTRLDDEGDLATVLADAIAAVADRFGIVPGEGPSTTVALVRWTGDVLDVLVLGDSPVIVYLRDGTVGEVRDPRLAAVTSDDRRARPGFATERLDAWRVGHVEQLRLRNRPGGYWIAEADPDAAHHAVRARWPLAEVDAVLALTDGVSEGVDHYGVPPDWAHALTLARIDPARLVEAVHAAEEGDPDGVRWPRGKRHDDKAVALVDFTTGPGGTAGSGTSG